MILIFAGCGSSEQQCPVTFQVQGCQHAAMQLLFESEFQGK